MKTKITNPSLPRIDAALAEKRRQLRAGVKMPKKVKKP